MLKNKDYLVNGSIFRALFLFSLPLIITNTVQVLFHAADTAILGIMASDQAVAAVGACGPIITMLVSIFTGFSAGANVLVARRFGAQDEDGVKKAIGTSLLIGFSSGLILMVIALIFSRSLLILLKCQPEVLDMATLYMQIYFLGMPITMLYNFVASILRASGDSFHPMLYMLIAGGTNVALNVLFVGAFHLDVAGVAIATVLSNAIALTLALISLLRSKGMCRVELPHLRIRRIELMEIVRVGIPASMSAIFFYVGNLFLSAAVNQLSTDAMAASTIASQFDGLIYTVGAAIAGSVTAMVGQNFGAKKFDRVSKTIKTSILYVTAVSLSLGVIIVLFADPLLNLMTDSPNVAALAKSKMTLLCLTYFITSIMEVFSGALRALGRQNTTMVVGAISGLGFRSLWALFVFPLYPTLGFLYSVYNVSAFFAIIIYICVYRDTRKKLFVTQPTDC